MSENKKDETFTYTYSAKQQQEIQAIRQKYLPPNEDKMTLLRRLDAQATRRGTTAALVIGTIGCLVLGIGMCCCMVWADRLFIPGIIIGIIGMGCMAMALPLYNRITAREREKLAPEILKLTDELLMK